MRHLERTPISPPQETIGNVLCVDDDPVAQLMFKDVVNNARAHYTQAGSLQEATDFVKSNRFDLIILDRKLPDGDGLLLIESAKRHQPDCRIMIVSTLDENRDKILGIGLGATEYFTKPINPIELGSLIHQFLSPSTTRETTASQNEIFYLNHARFNPRTRALKIQDTEIYLPPSEARLLHALLNANGEPLSRDALTLHICGREWFHGDRTVDVLISRLRQKIPKDAAQIITVNRFGYVLNVAA